MVITQTVENQQRLQFVYVHHIYCFAGRNATMT